MIDLEQIRQFYQLKDGLDIEDVQKLLDAARHKVLQPTDFLIREGSLNKEVFFIKSGLIRGFAINDKGDEITVDLRAEHQLITNLPMILFNEPMNFSYQAIEITEVLYTDHDLLHEIVSHHPRLEENRKSILLNIIKKQSERVGAFVMYSPEERYIKYVEEYPDIINRVPNKYIANYLGMTPVSLSRIRKRIANKRR